MASLTNSSSVSSAKVNVAIRVRPLVSREITTGAKSKWKTDGQTIQQVNPVTKSPARGTPSYTFDYAFGPETGTPEIYNAVVAPIVAKSFQGFNGTVLCYGQTSSGKTHTLYGNQQDPGIISLMAEDLFQRIRDGKRVYYIRIGLLEIYNENMTDLLNDNRHVEDMEVGGVVVPKNLTEIEVVSPEQILEAAQRVQLERKVGETIMNQQSSRSHTILRIVVESAPRETKNDDEDNDLHLTTAVLNFVDLAGSEKASKTANNEERFTESNYINKSLTSLSKVVMELSKTNFPSVMPAGSTTPTISRRKSCMSKSSRRENVTPFRSNSSSVSSGPNASFTSKQPYINFRDSKLTRILQSSLNGNAFVTMICNLSPASVPESHSTLRFAKAAKEIKTDPTQNRKLLQIGNEYEMKISDLELSLREKSEELEKLKGQLFVMQSFQRVCSPVPETNEGKSQNGSLRKKSCQTTVYQNMIQKGTDFDFSLTPQGRKEGRNQKLGAIPCVNIPFAEWARTKKESKKIIVECDSLKARLLLQEESEKTLVQEKCELKSQLEMMEIAKQRSTEEMLDLTEKLEESMASGKSCQQRLTKTGKDLNSVQQRLASAKTEVEGLASNLRSTKQRLIHTERENERLIQESLALQLKIDNMSITEKSFESVGIQVSCETYSTQYMNYLRDYRDENVKLNLQVKELQKEIDCMKLQNSANKIRVLKEQQVTIVSKEDREIQYSPNRVKSSQKCRFPSFLVPWKSMSE